MERLKWEKQRDERLRQQIRENSTELRELEAKLRAGYMNKERAAQLAEKETLRCLEEEREAEIAAMMKSEHDKAVEMEEKKEVQRWERSIQYQEQLERQLEEQVSIQRTAVWYMVLQDGGFSGSGVCVCIVELVQSVNLLEELTAVG